MVSKSRYNLIAIFLLFGQIFRETLIDCKQVRLEMNDIEILSVETAIDLISCYCMNNL